LFQRVAKNLDQLGVGSGNHYFSQSHE
jgi:hypothetical protein